MNEYEYESKPVSPASGFFILLGLMGAGLVVGGLVGIGAWIGMTGRGLLNIEKDMLSPAYTNAARVMQIVSVIFMFLLPALIVARIMDREPLRWLGVKEGFNAKQLGTVVLILAACLPMVGALGELNQAIPLSKGLEMIVKKMEDNYSKEAEALATMRSFGDFIFSLVVIALLPAVFEEAFFRGGMQQLLIAWFKKPMIAIIVTSVLFSIMHISWYGFLPRFALGMVLGLIFYYSHSIWLNMALHFLNNAFAVSYMYYLSAHNKPVSAAMDDNSPIWMGIPAVIVVALLFRYFQQVSFKRNINKIPPMDGPSFTSTLV